LSSLVVGALDYNRLTWSARRMDISCLSLVGETKGVFQYILCILTHLEMHVVQLRTAFRNQDNLNYLLVEAYKVV
jgi:hypothetical protein